MDVKQIWRRVAKAARAVGPRLWAALALYLDDLLLVAGGVCFILAALGLLGTAAALAVAGVWLTVCALLVARSRGGGRK